MSTSLLLLSLALFTWGMGEGMFLYFQPIYLQQLGANTWTIASIFSAFGAAMMLAHIPAGYLSDRIGRKPLLLAAWGLGLAAAWAMALARTLAVFVAGWLTYGLTAFVSAPMNSYATAARGRMTPARVMTLISATYNLGAAMGALAGGWIGENMRLRMAYIIAAGVFTLSTALVCFLRPQPRERQDTANLVTPLFVNQRYLIFLGITFVAIFAMYLPQPLTPKFLESERGLSLGAIGFLGFWGSLGNALVSLVLGRLEASLGFLLAQGAVALAAALFWQGRGVVWFACAYLLLGGFRAARSLIFAQVRSWITSAQMGLAYGVSESVNSLAIVLAPLLAGRLYIWRPVSMYIAALALILLAMSAFLLFPSGSCSALQRGWKL